MVSRTLSVFSQISPELHPSAPTVVCITSYSLLLNQPALPPSLLMNHDPTCSPVFPLSWPALLAFPECDPVCPTGAAFISSSYLHYPIFMSLHIPCCKLLSCLYTTSIACLPAGRGIPPLLLILRFLLSNMGYSKKRKKNL